METLPGIFLPPAQLPFPSLAVSQFETNFPPDSILIPLASSHPGWKHQSRNESNTINRGKLAGGERIKHAPPSVVPEGQGRSQTLDS